MAADASVGSDREHAARLAGMARIVIRGLLAGTVAAVAMVAFVLQQSVPPLPTGAQLVGLAGVSTTVSWWVLQTGRATRMGVARWLRVQRARRIRRAEVAKARAYEPTPRFGDPDDEATSAMMGLQRVGSRQRSVLRSKAERAVSQGEFVRARRLLTEVVLSQPTVADHIARGRVSLDLGDFNRAIADFMAAEDLDPVHPDPPAALGDLFFARKDVRRALDHYAAARALDPDNAEVRYRCGLCWLELREDAKALRELRRARRLDPDLPQVAHHMERAQKRLDAARRGKGKAAKSGRRQGTKPVPSKHDDEYHARWGY